MKFRKKAVIVDAEIWDGSLTSLNAINKLSGKEGKDVLLIADGELSIQTLEGVIKANIGDYVIKGVKGELYPCKPDIFKLTYDEVRKFEWVRMPNIGDNAKYICTVQDRERVFTATYSVWMLDPYGASNDGQISNKNHEVVINNNWSMHESEMRSWLELRLSELVKP